MEPHGSEFKTEIRALRETFAALTEGADGILNRVDNPAQLERFKETLLQKTLEYVVQVDMAMGSIHSHRQKILATQMTGISTSN